MTFTEAARYFSNIEEISSRLEMTQLLSELFHNVTDQEIRVLCYLLQGRVAPLFEPVEFGIADKFMIRAIALSTELPEQEIVRYFREEGDLGKVIEKAKGNAKTKKNDEVTIEHVYRSLYDLTQINGEGSQEKKILYISQLLRKVDSLSARYIVRIPLGKMRLGFSDMTILDALSWMITGDKSLRDVFEQGYNIQPDIGYIARMVKEKGKDAVNDIHVKVGAPILSALCQRLPTAEEMIEKMGEVSVEPKFDGVRVQIHYKSKMQKAKSKNQHAYSAFNIQNSALRSLDRLSDVWTFSRNLEQTTAMYPELEYLSDQILAEEVILDTEAVGIDEKTGKILPFQETSTRRRKHGVQEALIDVPLQFFVFDILYKDGKELLSAPLQQRRAVLEETIQKGKILTIAPHIVTMDPDRIRSYHQDQREKNLEGVVVKRWDSPYESGRRSFNWVKFEEEEGTAGKLNDTVDAVVMGYYHGEGKRSGGMGAFLVGVRDQESIVSICKIGTGISDEQLQSLTTLFTSHAVKEQPKEYSLVSKLLIPDVWIAPRVVVEVAGDDMTKSPIHGSKLAIRFPRLIRIRTDKSVGDITTVSELPSL